MSVWFSIDECEENSNGSYFGIYTCDPQIIAKQIERPVTPFNFAPIQTSKSLNSYSNSQYLDSPAPGLESVSSFGSFISVC